MARPKKPTIKHKPAYQLSVEAQQMIEKLTGVITKEVTKLDKKLQKGKK